MTFKKNYVKLFELLCSYFKSTYLTYKWLHEPNLLLNNKTPIQLMMVGRGKFIINLIKFVMKENPRD